MSGTGLPDVFLVGGLLRGPGGAVAYRDLDDLYEVLAEAVALRSSLLSPAELRFLRRRLGMTQEDLGRLGGKSAQVAAMWEKGTRPVPVAESQLLRLLWIARHARRRLPAAVMAAGSVDRSATSPYVLRYDAKSGWQEHPGRPLPSIEAPSDGEVVTG